MKKQNVRKTQEEYVNELSNIQPNVTVIEQYVNSHTKITMRCNIHNLEFQQAPTSALSGKFGCPICAKNNGYHIKKTHAEFIQEVKEKFPSIQVLGLYVDAKTPVLCECLICHHQWPVTPDNLLRKNGCPQCSMQRRGKKRRKTHEQFLQEMEQRHPEMIVNSEYISSDVKVNCTCKICGHTNNYYPATLTHGSGGCFVCGNKKIAEALTMPETEFLDRLNSATSDIVVVGGYQKVSGHVDVECAICGFQWSPVAQSLLSGCGCPQCSKSHGEKRIEKYLNTYGIQYTPQKTFEGLVGVGSRLLSYDFYLNNYNILIEYQGEYHDGTAMIQTEEEFLKQQEHDRRKREYSKKHGIQLLEIWYWDFDNIEEILNDTLHNLVTTTAV